MCKVGNTTQYNELDLDFMSLLYNLLPFVWHLVF